MQNKPPADTAATGGYKKFKNLIYDIMILKCNPCVVVTLLCVLSVYLFWGENNLGRRGLNSEKHKIMTDSHSFIYSTETLPGAK